MTQLEEWFHLLNSRHFHGRLKNVEVKWNRKLTKKGRMGNTFSSVGPIPTCGRKFLITIANEYRTCRRVAIMTLLHEMVHVEQWDEVQACRAHGRKFERRMKQLAARGAFSGLW
jgi:predicted SprT family Zn-dependent metalloprotease